jgi:hypothetical protein
MVRGYIPSTTHLKLLTIAVKRFKHFGSQMQHPPSPGDQTSTRISIKINFTLSSSPKEDGE